MHLNLNKTKRKYEDVSTLFSEFNSPGFFLLQFSGNRWSSQPGLLPRSELVTFFPFLSLTKCDIGHEIVFWPRERGGKQTIDDRLTDTHSGARSSWEAAGKSWNFWLHIISTKKYVFNILGKNTSILVTFWILIQWERMMFLGQSILLI